VLVSMPPLLMSAHATAATTKHSLPPLGQLYQVCVCVCDLCGLFCWVCAIRLDAVGVAADKPCLLRCEAAM
jgi:hypothetical protein